MEEKKRVICCMSIESVETYSGGFGELANPLQWPQFRKRRRPLLHVSPPPPMPQQTGITMISLPRRLPWPSLNLTLIPLLRKVPFFFPLLRICQILIRMSRSCSFFFLFFPSFLLLYSCCSYSSTPHNLFNCNNGKKNDCKSHYLN